MQIRTISIALSSVAAFACGDNNRQDMPDAAPLTPDAPPFAEAPHPDVPQVSSAGGTTIAAPIVVPIFFAGDGDAQAQIETFLAQVAVSPYWATTTSEYGVGALTIAPSIVSTDTPPTTDADLQTWLATNADGTHAGWPVADNNTIYTVYLPAGVVLTAGNATSCVAFGAYHDEAMGAQAQSLIYALVPRCSGGSFTTLQETTAATSHELVEAVTDPRVATDPAFVIVDQDHAVMNRTPGGELGDMCEYERSAYQTGIVGDFLVQRTWSNKSARDGHDPCVPAMATPYISAAPVLEDVTIMTHNGTSTTKGVTVNMGTPATIEVDLFSDAATADWKVVAVDAATLQGRTAKLDFTWDTQTGHNGDKRQLTITRTMAGTAGRTSEFAIESVDANGVTQSIWWGLVAGQ